MFLAAEFQEPNPAQRLLHQVSEISSGREIAVILVPRERFVCNSYVKVRRKVMMIFGSYHPRCFIDEQGLAVFIRVSQHLCPASRVIQSGNRPRPSPANGVLTRGLRPNGKILREVVFQNEGTKVALMLPFSFRHR